MLISLPHQLLPNAFWTQTVDYNTGDSIRIPPSCVCLLQHLSMFIKNTCIARLDLKPLNILLFVKTKESNLLQMSLQRQHFLLSYFKDP